MHMRFSRNLLALAVVSASFPVLAQEQSLNELVIVGDEASASALPGSAHAVSSEQLEEMKYTDVHRVAREVPGVYLREEEGYGLRPNIGIRGSGSGRSGKVTLMEDGVLMAPAPYSGPAAYYFPSFGRMSGVEVLKGPDLLRYGPATVGGAINLRSTPIPASASGHLTTELSDNDGKRVHAWYGASSDQVGWLIETHQQETDGFKDIRQSNSEAGFDKKDFVGKLRFNSSADAAIYQQLDLKIDYSEELSRETYVGLADVDFDADPDQRYFASERDNMDNQRIGFMARHLADLSDDLTLTTTAYRNEFERNWYKAAGLKSLINGANGGDADALAQLRGEADKEDIEIKNNAREYESQGVDFKADYRLALAGLTHDLTFGARYHEDEVDRLQPVDTYNQVVSNGRPVLEYVSTTSGDDISGGNNAVEKAEAWSAYVADRVALTDRLTVTGLLRFEDIETSRVRYNEESRSSVADRASNDTSELLPGLGATYDLGNGVTLLGGVHRGMAPAGAGSTDVDPEISINYELGARLNQGAGRYELIGFYSDYSNTVQNCSVATPCAGGQDSGSVSQGESRIQGLEALAAYDFDLGNGLTVPVQATWTLTDAEVTKDSDSGDVLKGDNLVYLPENVFNVRTGLRQGDNWDAYLNVAYVDDMCIDNSCDRSGSDNTFRKTEALTVVDLSGSYRVADGARVFAKLDNVFDTRKIVSRSPDGARPNLPMTASVGLSVDF
ncbi:MAG: TonB-dependent receptor family protein [Pseudomonadota bacterium]